MLTTTYDLSVFSATMLAISTASAGSISDFDLNRFKFNIISLTGANPNAIATGTSNSVWLNGEYSNVLNKNTFISTVISYFYR